MNENIRQFFDNLALNYKHEESGVISELLDSLKLTKCKRVLDLGCGKGIISFKLAEISEGEVVALDLSSKMIELAKQSGDNPKVKFVNEDFYEFEDKKKFDAIICFDAYPHFLNVEGFVNKAYGLLKEDGLLAIIHDCGREKLNSHHHAHALGVSRMLKSPKEEFEAFKKLFVPLELSESKNEYKLVMIKKER